MLLLTIIVGMNDAMKRIQKNKMGRPTLRGDRPLTPAEKQKRYREKQKALKRQLHIPTKNK